MVGQKIYLMKFFGRENLWFGFFDLLNTVFVAALHLSWIFYKVYLKSFNKKY